jgi:signal peptide peptidase SppA
MNGNNSYLVPHFARLDEYAGLWMIAPVGYERLRLQLASIDLAAHVQAAAAAPRPVATSYAVAEARNGRKVALVNLAGPMMKGQSSLGGASTIAARRAVRQAAADSEIAGIVLAVDSPGGTVAGTADLAADVRAAARKKPVVAHADDLMASAAYWVGSQADEIWANAPTALVGSIGTIISVTESAGRAERIGQRERVFATGPLKDVGGDNPITDEQAAYLQGLAETLQLEFDAAVKKGRRLSAAQMAEVKSGAVFPAPEAQRLGLINGVRSLEATIDAVASSK